MEKMNVNKTINPTKFSYKLGDIIYSPILECTGIIVGYYFIKGFNNYSNNLDYGYTLKRLDSKPGHNGNHYTFRANGNKLISTKYDLWCVPANTKLEIKKSLTSFIFKLLL